jgi:hypothetical protein
MKDMPDRPDLMKKWKARQKIRRRELASDSLDIDPRLEIGVNMPYTNTILKSQAYEEKLEKRQARGFADFAGWKDEIEENRQRMLALDEGIPDSARGRSLRESTIRQQSVVSSSSRQSSMTLVPSSASVAGRQTPKPPPSTSTSSNSDVIKCVF